MAKEIMAKEIYVFSNCIGISLFDENFKVIETIGISETDAVKISEGKWLDSEKEIIENLIEKAKKHLNHSGVAAEPEIYFIGFKNEKLEGVTITHEQKKLENALKHFKNKSFFSQFYDINLLQTKIRIRESVKEDLLLMQAISNIEDLDRIANVLSKRMREWYELYNPEYSRSVADHRALARNIISNTKEELLKKIKLSEEKSMGAELENEDYLPIKNLAKEIESIYSLRDEQVAYVENLTGKYCPHAKETAGALITAKLISLAGSFKKLAELPSSTIQLLGAEKALFRHMKTGAKPPKYGILMQHPAVANADKMERGRAARHLAQKIAIAVRTDYFSKKENRVEF